MSRNTCIISMGSFFSWLAFVLSGVALFAPFWFTTEFLGTEFSKGIVMSCSDPWGGDRDCDWTLKNTWEGAKDADNFGENWMTVQILWILGCVAFLINAILSFLLCCDSCKGPCCSITLTVLVFIAAACLAISVIICWADNGDKWDRDVTLSGEYYDWGFYVALVSAISAVLAVVFMGFIICCTRND